MKSKTNSQKTNDVCIYDWIQKLGLSFTEQFLFAIIYSLDNENYCFASNDHLAKRMNLSPSRISYYINKFKKLGLIVQIGKDGEGRKLHVNVKFTPKEKPKQIVKTRRGGTCFHDLPHISINKEEEQQQEKPSVVVVFPDDEIERKKEILSGFGFSNDTAIRQFSNFSIQQLENAKTAVDQYAETNSVRSYQSLYAKAVRDRWSANTINSAKTQKVPKKHPIRIECEKLLEKHKTLFVKDYFVKEKYFFEFYDDCFRINLGRPFASIFYEDEGEECLKYLNFAINKMKEEKANT